MPQGIGFMQTRIVVSLSRRIGLVLLVAAGAINGFAAPVLVDSFMGGSVYSYSPFRGQLGVTSQWSELGGSFMPDQSSRLLSLDVSIYAEDGATGSAVMTIYHYDQSPGTSLSLGHNLGSAAVPLGSYDALVAFDFSTQNIQLIAGETYLYVLSDPGATAFDPFDPSWRAVEYQPWSGLWVNGWDRFQGFNYYTYNVGYGLHYQVFAEVPEPGSLSLIVAFLGVFCLRRVHAAVPNKSAAGKRGIRALVRTRGACSALPERWR